jgi:CBS domain containing-hemolysin-like protein
MTGVVVGVLAALVLLSAVLTAAGTAAFQVSGSRLRTLSEEGFKGADHLARLQAERGRTRSGLRIVTSALNLVVVGVGTMSSHLALGNAATIGILLAGILTVLFVTDVLPRTLAAIYPVRLALVAAPFLAGMTRFLHLAARPFARLEAALTADSASEVTHVERELREIQELGKREGVLEETESQLVERAFRLDELTAFDIMTPRVEIHALKDALRLEEAVHTLSEIPYSRVPVYRDSVDDVTGILFIRDAYEAFVDGNHDLTLRQLAHDPLFVPGSLSLSRLLRDFQARRVHMGIVADEFGGIDGLVTLEDVLEELVGDIEDEKDVAQEELTRISSTEVLADAGVDLRDINDALSVSLPLEEYRTLNGFILEELGHVPEPGEVLERAGVRIEVVDATETQVVRARIRSIPTATIGRGTGD